ncbi:TonB-dependent receptor [bacterium]|nr:TonB-dependent receptor [bacterium]
MKRQIFIILLMSVFFMSVLSSPATAQQIEELIEMSLEELMNVEVTTASKYGENINDAPGIITVVSRQEIEGFAARNLGQVLNRVVSTYFISANVWSDNLVFFRGQTLTPYNNHTLILLNGRPVRDPISGGLNSPVYASFPVDVIDHLEIIRGPGSVLYGSCAYSGVINIITRRLDDDGHSIHFDLTYGSFGTYAGSTTALIKKNNLIATVGISVLVDDGPLYDFTDYSGIYSAANFDRKTLGLMTNLKYKNSHINFYYGIFNPYGLSGSQNSWTDLDPHSSVNQCMMFADAGLNIPFNEKFNATFNVTYNSHHLDQENNREITAIDVLLEGCAFYRPNENCNLIIGGIIEHDSYKGDVLIDDDTAILSFYSQADYKILPEIKLIAGFQYNKIEGIDGNFSPRAGFIAKLGRHLGFKGLFSTAFRKAYPLETSFDHPVFRGNLNISPELIATAEFQLFYETEKLQSSLTYFQSHMSDIIIRNWHEDLLNEPYGFYLKYANGSTHNWWGIEFEEKYKALDNLLITGNMMYQCNKNAVGIENAALHPNFMLKIGFLYRLKKMSIGVYNSYFSKSHNVSILNPDVDLSNPLAEAYSMLSVKLDYTLNANLSLSVSGDNLLNNYVRYSEYTSRGVSTLIPLWKSRVLYAAIKVVL